VTEPTQEDIDRLAEFIATTTELAGVWWNEEMPESPEAILAVRSLAYEVLHMLSHIAQEHGTVHGCNFVTGFLGAVHTRAAHALGERGEGRFMPVGMEVHDD